MRDVLRWQSSSRCKRHSGTSLAEYGLILGLVALCSVGALSVLGQSTGAIFQNMLPAPPSTPVALTATGTNAGGTNGTGTVASVPQQATGPQSSASVPVMPSISIATDLKSATSQLTKSIQTLGANGTTSMLASTLQQAIAHIMADPNLTDSQKNALSALANQGHLLANHVQSAQDYLEQNKDNPAQLLNTPMTFQGTQYKSLKEFAYAFGDTNPNGGMQQNDLAQLYTMLDQARQSGALSNPQDDAIVSQLVGQIGVMADGFSQGVLDVANIDKNNISKLDERTSIILSRTSDIQNLWDLTGIQQVAASLQMHTDSAGVCTVGGGVDSGKSCP